MFLLVLFHAKVGHYICAKINMSFSIISHSLRDQIYLFVRDRPDFAKKTNQLMIIDYLRELHDGPTSEFKFIEPVTVIGDFGEVNKIVIRFAPSFMDKELFFKWLDRKLNI